MKADYLLRKKRKMERPWMMKLAGVLLLLMLFFIAFPLFSSHISFTIPIALSLLFMLILIRNTRGLMWTLLIITAALIILIYFEIIYLFPTFLIPVIANAGLILVGLIALRKPKVKFFGFIMVILGIALAALGILNIYILEPITELITSTVSSIPSVVYFVILILIGGLVIKGGSFLFKIVGIALAIYSLVGILMYFGLCFIGLDIAAEITEQISPTSFLGFIGFLFIGIFLILKGTKRLDMAVRSAAVGIGRGGFRAGRGIGRAGRGVFKKGGQYYQQQRVARYEQQAAQLQQLYIRYQNAAKAMCAHGVPRRGTREHKKWIGYTKAVRNIENQARKKGLRLR